MFYIHHTIIQTRHGNHSHTADLNVNEYRILSMSCYLLRASKMFYSTFLKFNKCIISLLRTSKLRGCQSYKM